MCCPQRKLWPDAVWCLNDDPPISSHVESYTDPVAAIVTSPPYGEAQSGGGIAIKGHHNDPGLAQRVYSPRAMAGVDVVLTSPPYEISLQNNDPGWLVKHGNDAQMAYHQKTHNYEVTVASHYAESTGSGNIGNLRGPAFWEACTQVLTECRRVLKPSGNFVLITKGFTRDGAYVDLPGQFRSLMESLGFGLVDHWRRQLWGRSFWRVLQRNRDPDAWDDRLDYEDVHCYRKPPP